MNDEEKPKAEGGKPEEESARPAITFERVYVINLRRRPDRLSAFRSRLASCDWPFPQPVVVEAIEGDTVGVPKEFTQGGGAYGCRMSHLRILQDCLMQGVESVLVLEDDADFLPDFGRQCREFLAHVPDDWEGIMLGGQHHQAPTRVSDSVVRVQYAQRTHAYACRGRYMRDLQRRWGNCTVHIDWQMKAWQHQYRVYAPTRWLIGQCGGRSDIRGKEKPVEWWNEPRGDEPVVLLHAPKDVVDSLRRRGFHCGLDYDERTGIDKGLPPCFQRGIPNADMARRLATWIKGIQKECGVGARIATVWHHAATRELVAAAWPKGQLVEITASSVDEAFEQLPAEIAARLAEASQSRQAPVVLLRAPREVLDTLRARHGFHSGYWRDPKTGVDNGLAKLLALPPGQQKDALQKWLDVLQKEADRDGRIVTAWLPDLPAGIADLFRAAGAEVQEIAGSTAEEVVGQVVDREHPGKMEIAA